MSSAADAADQPEDQPPICEFCGGEITEEGQDCPALFIGECAV